MLDPSLALSCAGGERFQPAARFPQFADGSRDLLTLFPKPRELVQDGQLHRGLQDRELLRLPVDIDETVSNRTQFVDSRRGAVDTGASPAALRDGSFDDADRVPEAQLYAHFSTLSASCDDLATSPGAENEGQRIDDDRFPGARLASEHRQPRAWFDGDRPGNSKSGYVDPFKHPGSSRSKAGCLSVRQGPSKTCAAP